MHVFALSSPRRLFHKISIALALVFTLSSPTIHASGGGSSSGITDGQANYFTLEPAFVANIIDGRKLRYMQVGLDLMSMDSHAIQAVQDHHAPIRHELLMLFTHLEISDVMGMQQREHLRQEALKRIQDTLLKYAGINSKDKVATDDGKKYRTGIQEVLFTSFVIQ